MTKNSIMVDLDDPRTVDIADVISNKTSKKILSLLSEGEFSEAEISSKLGVAINTIGYNIKKLENTGLIEKTNEHFWSVKGKRVHRYKVSNKSIVITPRTIIRGVIPTILITGAIAIGIKLFTVSTTLNDNTAQLKSISTPKSLEAAEGVASTVSDSASILVEKAADAGAIQIISNPNYWLWFLAGALSSLLIYLLYNWGENAYQK